jgi:hypothetical protein
VYFKEDQNKTLAGKKESLMLVYDLIIVNTISTIDLNGIML